MKNAKLGQPTKPSEATGTEETPARNPGATPGTSWLESRRVSAYHSSCVRTRLLGCLLSCQPPANQLGQVICAQYMTWSVCFSSACIFHLPGCIMSRFLC